MTFKLKKPERLTENLPAAAVTPEMLAQVEEVHQKEDVSISAVIRAALEFFLAAYFGKPIDLSGNPIQTRADDDK